MKKRLLYILHCYYNIAGTEEHTRLLSSGLADEFDIWIAAPDKNRIVLLQGGKESTSFPIEPIPWPVAPYRSASHESALHQILGEIKPNVIHVQHFIHWHLGLLDQLLATKIPLFITFHDYFAITPQFTMLGIQDPRVTLGPKYSQYHFGENITEYLKERREILLQALSKIKKIVPSHYLAELHSVVFPGEYKVINHGIVPFEILPTSPSTLMRFGCLGSLIPQKGYHSLLEGFSRFHKEFSNTQLILFGDGEHADTTPRDGVHFAGRYERQDLSGIMPQFDIGVIPSIFAETFCLVLSELWLAKKPVVTSAIGALNERIQDGVNGKHFAPGDPDAIHLSLKWFMENDAWRNWEAPTVRLADDMFKDYRTLYHEAT